MIVKKLSQIENTERDVSWGNGKSRRFLLETDNMGYSLTDTIVEPGTESFLEYKNHLETCYCIEGEGEVEKEGKIYPITPGTLYALDKNDAHVLRAKSRLRLICVFNPPLKGEESHSLNDSLTSSY